MRSFVAERHEVRVPSAGSVALGDAELATHRRTSSTQSASFVMVLLPFAHQTRCDVALSFGRDGMTIGQPVCESVGTCLQSMCELMPRI